MPGMSWVVGNGREVRFWTDKWLTTASLQELTVVDVPQDQLELRVSDLWGNQTGWDFSQICTYVPETVRLRLLAVVLDNVTGAKDRLSWGPTPDGKFTVSSAYKMMTRDDTPRVDMSCMFAGIWGAVVPERVRIFLWLVVNQ